MPPSMSLSPECGEDMSLVFRVFRAVLLRTEPTWGTSELAGGGQAVSSSSKTARSTIVCGGFVQSVVAVGVMARSPSRVRDVNRPDSPK